MCKPLTETHFPGWQEQPSRGLVIDEGILSKNIATMQKRAGTAELRPHVKTHKSVDLARMQQAAGAAGFTVALPEEALMLLEAGLGPVTIARPVLARADLEALFGYAAPGQLRFCVDCAAHVEVLSQVASRLGAAADVLIKVDVGLHRLGIVPEAEVLAALAAQITAPLRYAGILSHAGHSYGASSPDDIRAIAAQEAHIMTALAAAVPAAGGKRTVISVGATPTLLAGQDLGAITEIRPGNYILLDLTAVRLGVATRADIAMAIVTTVIGTGEGRVVVDAGSKVLSSDRGAHGTSAVAGYGELWLAGASSPLTLRALSEEHGIASPVDGIGVRVGQRGLILPNHSCPVMNLGGVFTLLPSAAAFRLGPTSPDILRKRLSV